MVAASIVVYKTDSDELRSALRRLDDSSVVGRIDVVDNSSEKRLKDVCLEFARVNYIPSENVGYGAAHNKSLRSSIADGCKYHLVMNSDLEFDPDALEKMVAYMDEHPEIGLLHPRILGLDGKDQFTARMLPTPADLIVRRFLPNWFMPKRRKQYLLMHHDRNIEMDVAYVQGSFMLLRASCLKEVGVFDERFFMYPEDIDLSRRISEKYRVVYFPSVKIVHAHRAESYKSGRMLRIHILNIIKYFNKWGWLIDPYRKKVNQRLRR